MHSPVDKLLAAGVERLKLETVDKLLQEMAAAEHLDSVYQQFVDSDHSTNFVLLICQLL
jgi:hypothetical protein